MKAKTSLPLLAFLTLAFLALIPQSKPSITGVSPPASGTWDITADTFVIDEDLIINGSINIHNTYTLQLQNSTIRMNLPSYDGQYGIFVGETGLFNVFANSKILNYTQYSYWFFAYGKVYFDHFEVEGVGYNSGEYINRTMFFYTNDNILTYGSIHGLKGGGIYFAQHNNVIANLIIYDSPQLADYSIGIWLGTNSNHNSIYNVTIFDFWRGINEDGHHNIFNLVTIHNTTQYGIALYGHDNAIYNSVVYNSLYGITSTGGSYNNLIHETIAFNNTWDGMNTDFGSHNITFDHVAIYNSGVGFGLGQQAYDITLTNAIVYNISLTSGFSGDRDYGAININENITNIFMANVSAYNSKYGLNFRGDSKDMGYFKNVNLTNCDFRWNVVYDIVFGSVVDKGNATIENMDIINTFWNSFRWYTNAGSVLIEVKNGTFAGPDGKITFNTGEGIFSLTSQADANLTLTYDGTFDLYPAVYINGSEVEPEIDGTYHIRINDPTDIRWTTLLKSFESLLPFGFIMGMVGLGSMFGGSLWMIKKCKEHEFIDAISEGFVISIVGAALFIAWLWV